MKDKHYKVQNFHYFALFGYIGTSLVIFILYIAMDIQDIWDIYLKVYFMLALTHIWYTYFLLLIGDIRPRKYQKYANEKVVVIIPCFNEDHTLLVKSLESVIHAEGNKEIIVIDDGSTNGVHNILKNYLNSKHIKVHFLDRNMGKREALRAGVEKMLSDGNYIVTLDSDTIIDKYALIRIVEPLLSEKIGAASGDIRLINENDNLLTKMTSAYYWVALHMSRKAQSNLGMVNCCSGALAAYKSSIIRHVIDDFVNQEFRGEKCTYADDRHLTNLVLKEGYDVVFESKAIAYTYTPTTYRQFIKQQLRWRRGFIKEATFALTFTWRTKPLLFIEILIWELGLPLLSAGLIIFITINLVLQPLIFLLAILTQLVTLATVRHLPLLLYEPKKYLSLIHYTFFTHFIMYWIGIYALFTLKTKSWSTR